MVIASEILPENKIDLQTTSKWRVTYAFPIPFLLISLYSFLFYYKEYSLIVHLQNDEDEKVRKII